MQIPKPAAWVDAGNPATAAMAIPAAAKACEAGLRSSTQPASYETRRLWRQGRPAGRPYGVGAVAG
ncbi:MAG TPA: hypothetical protein PLK47_17785, partial [Plasticicumulans sp.]|nr:hypothetical protein [Plasticicumulans sp.]